VAVIFVRVGKSILRIGFSAALCLDPMLGKPLKSGRKRKYTHPKMCKSQIRKKTGGLQPRAMLMANELHNWLLFMALNGETKYSQNRPLGLCSKKSRKRFSIPQAFPQADRISCPMPQT
jgi:hypothetical protein